MTKSRRDGGYTLIETVIVVSIIGILTAVGIISLRRMTGLAEDRAVQLDLVTAIKVQMLHHLESGEFTDDAVVLHGLEPNIQYSATGDDGTLVVLIQPGREAEDVCLFGRSANGGWFSVYHSVSVGDRFGTSAPVGCVPANVAGWGTAAW